MSTRSSGNHPAVQLVGMLLAGGIAAVFVLPVAVDVIEATSLPGGSSGGFEVLWSVLPEVMIFAVFVYFAWSAVKVTR